MARGPSPVARDSWTWKRFNELTPDELYEILKLRALVFVVEQNCAYQDMDDADRDALHLFRRRDDGCVDGYLRLLPPGVKYDDASIGRVISHPDSRGTGLGRELMRIGIERCAAEFPGYGIRLNAQSRLEKFYNALGFETVSAPYMEDGIEHVEMLRRPT